MNSKVLVASLVALVFAPGTFADLVFPASLEVTEETPGQCSITMTLPMVKGRFVKARPIFPDAIKVEGEPATVAGPGSIQRTWQARVEPGSLAGAAIGLDGLLGTSLEARFILSTLDGRRHEAVLRPTQPFFIIPVPPEPGALAAVGLRDGLRQATRYPGLWFVLGGLLVAGVFWRRGTVAAAALVVVLVGAFLSGVLAPQFEGLSEAETRLVTGFLFVGWTVAGVCIAAVLWLTESLLSEGPRRRFHWLLGLLASTWVFYRTAGLAYTYGPACFVVSQRLLTTFIHQWFTPFATDWAMARLRIPWVSLVAVAAGVWALFHITPRRTRFAVTGALLGCAVVLLPWGVSRVSVPFISPQALAPAQAQRILEPMLSRIYRALNLEDEYETYDRLADHVSSELITDLYLDSRRRLYTGTREGASVAVRDVSVLDVGTPLASQASEAGILYPCTWTVTVKVTHWQHSHERRNLYAGDLCLSVKGDRWKLAGIDLHSEEREVVPGSFSSR